MGEPNNALKTYMNRPNRIRDLMEYYLGEKLPEEILGEPETVNAGRRTAFFRCGTQKEN